MPLADEARWVLDLVRRAGVPEYCDLTPEAARADYESSADKLAPPWRALYRVVDDAVDRPAGAIPLRIYTPREFDGPAPVLVWMHGGGHVIGSLDSYDRLCRELAFKADGVVISVDYRLAPEHRFPAAVDDCLAAFGWVVAEAPARGWDARRIAVGGDSAGANLAAVCTILARDAGLRGPCFQLLVYPPTSPRPDSGSQREFALDHLLTRRVIDWFQGQYVGDDANRDDFRFAPLVADDLSRLAPALLIVAECDPLRDEGLAYAERLRAAGNQVAATCYPGMIHAFFSMSGALQAARDAVDEAAGALRQAWG